MRSPCPLSCLAALAAVSSAVGAQALRPGRPADVGLSEVVLRAGAALFEQAVARDELRGAVVLVARRGRIVLHEAFGWRDAAGRLPMERDTLFRMASNTKPLIAAAVLSLVEDGAVGLDDPVCRYLPSFDHDRSSGITIRHLLSHTAGLRIRPIFLEPLLDPPGGPRLRAEVARFGAIGAAVEPGTSYSYSNAGFNTLGALIEVVSDQPLEEYLKARFYEPLGMADTCNHESRADPDRMSAVFRRGSDGKTWRIVWKPGDPPDYPFVRASGGMISTARDYAAFCQMFVQHGRYGDARILSERSVAEATAPQTEHCYGEAERASRSAFYGLGWVVSASGVYSHSGSDGTYAWVDPRHEIVGLVLTQTQGSGGPRLQFQRVVDAARQ